MFRNCLRTIAVGLPALLVVSGCTTQRGVDREAAVRTPAVTPLLMFQDGRAEEAFGFYASVFPGSRVVSMKKFGPGRPCPEGTVELGVMEIAGQRIMCTESPRVHAFDFTPSISFHVECGSVEELDRAYAALGTGGEPLMPPDNYGFSARFAWVKDRFKVSWQLNYAGK
ncbi:MAG: VOC family protein [Phycisphaerales bacterium]